MALTDLKEQVLYLRAHPLLPRATPAHSAATYLDMPIGMDGSGTDFNEAELISR